jgi:hypothetical protein
MFFSYLQHTLSLSLSLSLLSSLFSLLSSWESNREATISAAHSLQQSPTFGPGQHEGGHQVSTRPTYICISSSLPAPITNEPATESMREATKSAAHSLQQSPTSGPGQHETTPIPAELLVVLVSFHAKSQRLVYTRETTFTLLSLCERTRHG